MAQLQLIHIKNKLNEKLINLIDMSDYVKKTEEERKKACLSRSYAAYSLVSLASATEEAAQTNAFCLAKLVSDRSQNAIQSQTISSHSLTIYIFGIVNR